MRVPDILEIKNVAKSTNTHVSEYVKFVSTYTTKIFSSCKLKKIFKQNRNKSMFDSVNFSGKVFALVTYENYKEK